jgi:hypothetical protein
MLRVDGTAPIFEIVSQDGSVVELPAEAPATDEPGLD